MKQHMFPDYTSLCQAVAAEVISQLKRKPHSVLVFPTGNTPIGLFKELVSAHNSGAANFSAAQVVILDEYAGLMPGDPRSLADWLKRELLTPIALPQSSIHGFENGPDAMEKQIKRLGGLDLVILGLGPNGHLGFNEPGSAFDSRARRIDLTPDSIASNAAYWGSEDRVPRQGFTLGLGTLARAASIILMVSGSGKADILAKTLRGPISPANPASVLRRLAQSQVFADAAALAAHCP